ncbi:TolC family protein [Paeniroseomonas aquatica]|uniref:TolC family protein n=1 Tax=Paeniroseomonas aquatica TaxID=373043 RepID=A0ABT8AAA9_9PROT|nr:TolC family protein [Paeniroseomonas aquatica]MDN3566458.1 TolC family protein [Paeniroseomonas aquatica]
MRSIMLLQAVALAALLLVSSWANAQTAAPRTAPPLPAYPEVTAPRATLPRTAAPPRPLPRPAPGPARGTASLARHLDQAMALDATARALAAQRDAVAARSATVRSPIAGSPAVSGAWRTDTRGPREATQFDVEVGAPIWLPGQRRALGGSVSAAVAEVEGQLVQRELELAGQLREAWWAAALAAREARLARDRLATARDIARDVDRRAALGDIPASDGLLSQNETLAAELALSEAEANLAASRASYAVLTGGAMPDLEAEAPVPRNVSHPLLAAAEAGLAAAEAEARLVAATQRDNPELGLFGQSQSGNVTEQGVSFGVRLRLPLATEARNAPRRAAAQSQLTRATALLVQQRRLVNAGVLAGEAALRAAEEAARLARQRLGVADQQLDVARRAFRQGETGIFDLYRVRQLQLDAAGAEARAAVQAGRARSRLNQALGAVPGA